MRLENDIRRLRFMNGEMSQEKLADLVGVTRQTIISIEKGRFNPSVLLALRIAHAFGKRVEEVFSVVEDGSSLSSERE